MNPLAYQYVHTEELSDGRLITFLSCTICQNAGRFGGIQDWADDARPSLADVVSSAQRHGSEHEFV